jgi:hypothetical protein
MNRACQVHTTGFDLPDRRMISAVPQPSAVARITLARPRASVVRRDPQHLGIVRMNQTTSGGASLILENVVRFCYENRLEECF